MTWSTCDCGVTCLRADDHATCPGCGAESVNADDRRRRKILAHLLSEDDPSVQDELLAELASIARRRLAARGRLIGSGGRGE
jgi:uncharacterized Zn finger protein (UPF0148 family)